MKRGRVLCETVHLMALGVWLGAVLMTGATAGIAFTTLPELSLSLAEFANGPGEHGVIAAGILMAKVFLVSDAVQLGGATIAFVTLLLSTVMLELSVFRRATAARWGLMLAILISMSYYQFMLAPAMNSELASYWEAAKAGDTEVALEHKAAFDERHPRASVILKLHAGLVFGLFAVGLYAVQTTERERRNGGE